MKTQSVRPHRVLSAGLCTVLGLSAACGVEDPCDPGQTYRNGGCYPPEEDDVTVDEDTTEQGPADTNGSAIDGGPLPAGSEETAEPMEEANLGATCATQADCLGGTVCAADEGLPECLGLCGEGDPFEDSCPATNPCIELQGNFLCNPF
jgi:hypothetical protein